MAVWRACVRFMVEAWLFKSSEQSVDGAFYVLSLMLSMVSSMVSSSIYGVFGVVVDDGATCSVLGASTMGLFVREADAADAPRANMEYAPNATSAVEAPNTAMSCQMNPLRASHKCDILDK